MARSVQTYRLPEAETYHPGLPVGRLLHLRELYPAARYPGIWGTGIVDVNALVHQLAKDDPYVDEGLVVDPVIHDLRTMSRLSLPGMSLARGALIQRNYRARLETATPEARQWAQAFIGYGDRGVLVDARCFFRLAGFDLKSDGEINAQRVRRREAEADVRIALESAMDGFRLDPNQTAADQILTHLPRVVADHLADRGYYRAETAS